MDYSRSPTATGSAAIDPVFGVSETESYFWTSTTHLDGMADKAGSHAAYVAFGRVMGYMRTPGSSGKRLMEVHGAGAAGQRGPVRGPGGRLSLASGPATLRKMNHFQFMRKEWSHA